MEEGKVEKRVPTRARGCPIYINVTVDLGRYMCQLIRRKRRGGRHSSPQIF